MCSKDKSACSPGQRLVLPQDVLFWLIIAFALCASIALAIHHYADTPASYKYDSIGYHNLAVSILRDRSYHGFTYWTPGYPLMSLLFTPLLAKDLPRFTSFNH